jgi:GGDEF domain-containing protein
VLEECLKNELSAPLKTKTLAIFHLHHFNEINNTLGHSRADEILVVMALRFSTLCQNYPEVMSFEYGLYDQSGSSCFIG